jgi:hypothetical protein
MTCAESASANSSTRAGLERGSISAERLRAQRSACARARGASTESSVADTARFIVAWPGPSVMRASRPKTSAAGEATRAVGTGSAAGRTRPSGLVSTAVTASALAATHRPRASSR